MLNFLLSLRSPLSKHFNKRGHSLSSFNITKINHLPSLHLYFSANAPFVPLPEFSTKFAPHNAAWIYIPFDHNPLAINDEDTSEPFPVISLLYKAIIIAPKRAEAVG